MERAAHRPRARRRFRHLPARQRLRRTRPERRPGHYAACRDADEGHRIRAPADRRPGLACRLRRALDRVRPTGTRSRRL
ncbi:MAG: hypothetical protein D6744_08975 [Planctomycetota bacterium]|nr:MAG: hypothetical protein D6744_08975 [Planctomycetota bacterium]